MSKLFEVTFSLRAGAWVLLCARHIWQRPHHSCSPGNWPFDMSRALCCSFAGSSFCDNCLLPQRVPHRGLPAGPLLWLDPVRHRPDICRLQDEPQGGHCFPVTCSWYAGALHMCNRNLTYTYLLQHPVSQGMHTGLPPASELHSAGGHGSQHEVEAFMERSHLLSKTALIHNEGKMTGRFIATAVQRWGSS